MQYTFKLTLNQKQRKLLANLFMDLAKVYFSIGVGSPLVVSANILVSLTTLLVVVTLGVVYTYLGLKLVEKQ